MSNLPPYKIIDRCCQCGATNTAGRKVAKDTFCLSCHKNNKAKEQMDKAKLKNKLRSLNNYPANVENKIEKAEMDLFWLTAEQELEKQPYCRECGTFIPKEYYRAATAHILMKSIFESVKSNPDNRLFLGAGCGCHDKTNRLDTFSKMKVFPLAVMKFRLFEKDITEKHKHLDLFREYAVKCYMEQGWDDISKQLDKQ